MGIEDSMDENNMRKSHSQLQKSSEVRFCTKDDETAQSIGTAEVDSSDVRTVDMLSKFEEHSHSFLSGDISQHGADGVANVSGHVDYHNEPEHKERKSNMRQSYSFNRENIASVGLLQMNKLGAGENNGKPSLSRDSGHSATVSLHMDDCKQMEVNKSMVTTTQSYHHLTENERFLIRERGRSTHNALIEVNTSANDSVVSAHSNASVWLKAHKGPSNPAVSAPDGFLAFQNKSCGFSGLAQPTGELFGRAENIDGLPSFLQSSGESSSETQKANRISISDQSVGGFAKSKNIIGNSGPTIPKFYSNSPYMLPPQETGKEEKVTGTSGQHSDLEGQRSAGLANSYISEGFQGFPRVHRKPRFSSQTRPASPTQEKMPTWPSRFVMKDNVPEQSLDQLHNHGSETTKKIQFGTIQFETSMRSPMLQASGQTKPDDMGSGSVQNSDLSTGKASSSGIGPKPATHKVKSKKTRLVNPSINPASPERAQADPAAVQNAQTTPPRPVQTANFMSQSTQTALPPTHSAFTVPHPQWLEISTPQQIFPDHLLIGNNSFHSSLVPPMHAGGTSHQHLAQAALPQPFPNTLSIARGNFLHPFLVPQVPIRIVQGEGTLQQHLAQRVSPQSSSLTLRTPNPLSVPRGTLHHYLAQQVPTPTLQGGGTLQQPFAQAVSIQPAFPQQMCNPSSSVMGTHHPSLAHAVSYHPLHAQATFQQTLTQAVPPWRWVVKKPPACPQSQVAHPRPLARNAPLQHIKWQGPEEAPELSGENCFLCKRDLSCTPEGPFTLPPFPPQIAVLPCGHCFHFSCLDKITPEEDAADPPCICCAIGEN